MIDHTSFATTNYEESLKFYDAALGALGYQRTITLELPEVRLAGFGNATSPRPFFWISDRGNIPTEQVGNASGVHIAFVAPSVDAVNLWYKACLENGGQDNGAPGPRHHYHPGYYGAFIIDPSGWRIEACFHHFVP